MRSFAAITGAAGLLGLTAISGALGVTAAGAASNGSNGRTPLAGSEMPAAARAHPAGSVSRSSRVDFQVVLQLRNEGAAKALVQAVSTPGSPSFRHYVTASQWESQFSPSNAQVARAKSWLRSQGFTVGAVARDRITISASGTAAQVESAFGTGLQNYQYKGHTVRFATSNLSVPSSVAGNVVGALGVNQQVATPDVASAASGASTTASPAAASNGPFPPAPAAFVTSLPCGQYYNQEERAVVPPFGNGYPNFVPNEVCGYQPNQLRSAYGLSNSATGKGATVAIIDAYGSSTIASDASRFFKLFAPNLPFANSHFRQLDATPFNDEALCDASSWLTEQDIDVEAVHAMAPDATILYVGAKNCVNGLFTAEQNVIDNGRANVVTNSWGDTGGDLLDDVSSRTAFDDLFMLADSTGITVQFSSGDNGDDFNLLGVSTPDYPASSPFVTAVGGTTLKIGSAGQQIGQLGWATGRSFLCTANVPGCTGKVLNTWLPVSFDGGSGGYTSYRYLQPPYQAGVVPKSLATRNSPILGPTPTRVVPDISMDADPSTGILMGLHETFPNGAVQFGFTRFGGTSLASPLLAGVIADADQAAGVSLGFINPAIYHLDGTNGAITDVLPGGHQAQYRVDNANEVIAGGVGKIHSFREITYEGTITFCDGTGNCASRPNTLNTATGYDSMTGLGSIGPRFISDLARG
ncbi:MAG: S8/S53 family peptidase [Acidimicrobiaceae bacterium]|nr:S8/S53 family peptidase [Acidimicrobiaceae bacterium]